MDDLTAKTLFNQVKEIYNQIAADFSQTRSYNWEEMKRIAELANKWERVLDLGCGNGRFSELFDDSVKYFGIDNSENLIALAQKKYPAKRFEKFDGLKFPFADNFFNKVYCVAVFHHIPGKKMRRQFLREIKRVLRRDGKLILTVWSAGNYPKAKKYLKQYTIKKLMGLSKMDFGDVLLPWGQNNQSRYIHFFKEKKLVEEIKQAGFNIKESGFLKRADKEYNMCVVAEK